MRNRHCSGGPAQGRRVEYAPKSFRSQPGQRLGQVDHLLQLLANGGQFSDQGLKAPLVGACQADQLCVGPVARDLQDGHQPDLGQGQCVGLAPLPRAKTLGQRLVPVTAAAVHAQQVVPDLESLLHGHLGEPLAQLLWSQQFEILSQPVLVRLQQVADAPLAGRVGEGNAQLGKRRHKACRHQVVHRDAVDQVQPQLVEPAAVGFGCPRETDQAPQAVVL